MRRLWSDLGPIKKTSQEMRMLSRSLSDCQSLTLNMSWFQFLNFSGIINCVTNIPISLSLSLSLSFPFFFFCHCQKGHMCLRQLCSALKTTKSKRQSFTHWLTMSTNELKLKRNTMILLLEKYQLNFLCIELNFGRWPRKIAHWLCKNNNFFWLPL